MTLLSLKSNAHLHLSVTVLINISLFDLTRVRSILFVMIVQLACALYLVPCTSNLGAIYILATSCKIKNTLPEAISEGH